MSRTRPQTPPQFPDAWTRRKARVREEAEAEARARREAAARQRDAEAAETPEAQLLADLNLPAPEEMGPGDDFAAFLSSAVPTALRNRALRRLWTTSPVLANLDDLLEYGEDFTGAGEAGGVIATAYRVGKGFLAPEPAEPEAESGIASEAQGGDEHGGEERQAGTQRGTEAGTEPAKQAGNAGNAETTIPSAPAPAEAETAGTQPLAHRAAPRHMQFHFHADRAPDSKDAPA